jgi:hypothetical protein
MSSATPDPSFASPVSAQGDVQSLPQGSQLVTAIQGRPVSASPPVTGAALLWFGSANGFGGIWAPNAVLGLNNPNTQQLQGTLNAGGLKINGLALPGTEIAYDAITSAVTITGTAASVATTIITGTQHTYDGAPVIAEFCATAILTAAVASSLVQIAIFEGSTQVSSLIAQAMPSSAAAIRVPCIGKARFTPSAGLHTYSVAAWNASSGSAIEAGSGAAAYLRITKV